MYNRPEQILEQYDLTVNAISKGRESYLCDTSQGAKLLREYRGSKERAGFLAQMTKFLKEQGLNVPAVMETKEESPIAVDEDETKYILTDLLTGAECDTKRRDDMMEAVRLLARLHNLSEGYPGEIPEFVKEDPGMLLELYQKHNRELRKVKNYVHAKKKKNEFEMLFMGQYAQFMQKAEEVTDLLSKIEPQEYMVGFCHGDYNQHNVLFKKQDGAIVHFDSFSYRVRMSDLANFLRKMMEKNNWNTGLGMDMIQAYHRERPLTEQELKYLYLYLAYPEKFWKIANRYYNSHKAWLSGRNIEKLEKVIAQEGVREQFLKMLFCFTTC